MKKHSTFLIGLLLVLALAACDKEPAQAPVDTNPGDTTEEVVVSAEDTDAITAPDTEDTSMATEPVSDTTPDTEYVDRTWPSETFPQPENCEITSIVELVYGSTVNVRWQDKEAAKAYAEVLKGLGETATAENEGETMYTFISDNIRVQYDAVTEKNNNIHLAD